MNVIKTSTVDSNSINLDQTSKILLMDKLIEHFSPLFYEELRKKQAQVKSNETDVKTLHTIIDRNKKILLTNKKDIEKESVKTEILKEIEYLNNIDVLYGKNKITVQSIVNAIDALSFENLKQRLTLLQKLVKQKKG
jgi:hypothetical protein